MNPLRQRIEAALVAHLTANAAGTALADIPVLPGQSDAELPDEAVVVYCESASPDDPLMAEHGNADARVSVTVASNANSTQPATHGERVEAARGMLRDVSDITTALSAEHVHLYALHFTGESEGRDGDRFGTVLSYSLPCVDNPGA